MKITKDNYNELKSKDLDNNYAKVWHVNEIREELLANTPAPPAYEHLVLRIRIIVNDTPTIWELENTLVNNTFIPPSGYSSPLFLNFEYPIDPTKFWGIAQGGNGAEGFPLLLVPESSTVVVANSAMLSTDDIIYVEIKIYP